MKKILSIALVCVLFLGSFALLFSMRDEIKDIFEKDETEDTSKDTSKLPEDTKKPDNTQNGSNYESLAWTKVTNTLEAETVYTIPFSEDYVNLKIIASSHDFSLGDELILCEGSIGPDRGYKATVVEIDLDVVYFDLVKFGDDFGNFGVMLFYDIQGKMNSEHTVFVYSTSQTASIADEDLVPNTFALMRSVQVEPEEEIQEVSVTDPALGWEGDVMVDEEATDSTTMPDYGYQFGEIIIMQ